MIKLPSYLEIKETPKKGRGIFYIGEEPCPPGTLLFSNLPFAYMLQYSLWNSRCQFCFQTGVNSVNEQKRLFRCGRCRNVYYCGQVCQRRHWSQQHKFECPFLTRFTEQCRESHVPSEDITDLILLGCSLRRLEHEDQQKCMTSSLDATESLKFSLLFEDKKQPDCVLESSASLVREMCLTRTLLKESHVVDILLQSQLLPSSFFKNHPTYMEQTLTLKTWLSAFQCNNFAIADPLLVPIGAGVFSLGSLINHSCQPNCMLSYNFETMQQNCHNLTSLRKGEELSHLYTEAALPTVERQLTLEATYGFVCECSRCTTTGLDTLNDDSYLRMDQWGNTVPGLKALPIHNGKPMSSTTLMMVHKKLMNVYRLLQHKSKQTNLEVEYELQNYIVQELESILGRWNLDLYTQKSELFSLALLLKRFSKALELGKPLVEFLQKTYSTIQNHPMIGIQFYTLGDLYIETQQYDYALEALEKAAQILSVAYGRHNHFVEDLYKRILFVKQQQGTTA